MAKSTNLIQAYNSFIFQLHHILWYIYALTETHVKDDINRESLYSSLIKIKKEFYKFSKMYIVDSRRFNRLSRFLGNMTNRIRFFGVTRTGYCSNYTSYGSLLYWWEVYFEAKYPYILIKLYENILFIIFSEEDNTVYVDIFFGVTSKRKISLSEALQLCYGISEDSVRLQGDLFLKYIPFDSLDINSYKNLFLESIRGYFSRSGTPLDIRFFKILLDYVKNTKFTLYVYLYILLRNAYFSSKNTIDWFSELGFSSYKSFLFIKRKHRSLEQKVNLIEKILFTRYFNYFLNIPLEIELRRGSNSNSHIISLRGFMIYSALVPDLGDITYLPRTSNIYAFFVSGDQDIIAKHPEHGISKYHIPKDGLLIIYLPG